MSRRPMATKIKPAGESWQDGWEYTAMERAVDAGKVLVASAAFLCIFAAAGALWVML